jgi:hypothetical protein
MMNPIALIGRGAEVIEGRGQLPSPSYCLSELRRPPSRAARTASGLPVASASHTGRLVMLPRKGPHLESSEPVATPLPERAVHVAIKEVDV